MKAEYHVLFPFSKVRKGSRIVLYGAGDVGQTFYWQIQKSGWCEVVGWIDKSWEKESVPLPFTYLKSLPGLSFDSVVIAIKSSPVSAEVRETLINAGISEEKILTAADCMYEYTLCGLNEGGAALWRRIGSKIGVKIPENTKSDMIPPQKTIRIGLSTTGLIASVMAQMIQRRLPEAKVIAVASRSRKKAEIFAKQYGIDRAYGSIDEMLADDDVELVHISSPAALHYPQVLNCLRHGKHVICEKPFALNERQAAAMFSLAEEKGLFLSDGLWTKHLPLASKLVEVCKSGRIGPIFAMSADCYYPGVFSPRINNNALGGGVLLENGLYLLSFVSLIFGLSPDRIEASGIVNENGIDIQDEVVLSYGDRVATLNFGIRGVSGRKGFIYGQDGYIEVQDANEYRKIIIYGAEGEVLDAFETGSGYQYEFLSCIKAISEGRSETMEQPHKGTLAIFRIADEIRRQIGVKYECD